MVIILMGVSGSGKTTIGTLLSERTGIPFFDGDDFHPDDNIRKMSQGTPLTDRDRVAWIEEIAGVMNGATAKNKILACSALNRFIRSMIIKEIREPCFFVFLEGAYALIKERMNKRERHYMQAGMLASQFESLEAPENALVVDIKTPPTQICDEICHSIREHLGK